MDVVTVGPWMLTVDPQMLLGTDEVWVDVIMGLDRGTVRSGWTWTLSWFGPFTPWRTDEAWVGEMGGADVVQVDVTMVDPWMLWGTDVWVDGTSDVIMVLACGCTGEPMRLPGFWPMDAPGNG